MDFTWNSLNSLSGPGYFLQSPAERRRSHVVTDFTECPKTSFGLILGGAALTPKFVNQDCASVYRGKVIYGKDAFTDLKFMDSYMKAKEFNNWDNISGFKEGAPEGITIGNYKNTNNDKKISIKQTKDKPIEDTSRSRNGNRI